MAARIWLAPPSGRQPAVAPVLGLASRPAHDARLWPVRVTAGVTLTGAGLRSGRAGDVGADGGGGSGGDRGGRDAGLAAGQAGGAGVAAVRQPADGDPAAQLRGRGP